MLWMFRLMLRPTPRRFARLVAKELVRDGVPARTIYYDADSFALDVEGEGRIQLHNAYLAFESNPPWHRQAALASLLAARRLAGQLPRAQEQ